MTSSETEARVPDTFTVAGNGITLVGDVWEPDGGDPVDEILMLHGGAQTRFSWNRAARRLSGEGYRVTTMDARGHGDSEWDPEGDYDIHRMAEDLDAVIAQRFGSRRRALGLCSPGHRRGVDRRAKVDARPEDGPGAGPAACPRG